MPPDWWQWENNPQLRITELEWFFKNVSNVKLLPGSNFSILFILFWEKAQVPTVTYKALSNVGSSFPARYLFSPHLSAYWLPCCSPNVLGLLSKKSLSPCYLLVQNILLISWIHRRSPSQGRLSDHLFKIIPHPLLYFFYTLITIKTCSKRTNFRFLILSIIPLECKLSEAGFLLVLVISNT